MKPRAAANPQNLDDLMLMAEDFAGFSLRAGRQIPPTLLAVTKRGPLFFTPESLQDDRSKDDFADTARLVCLAYQVPAAHSSICAVTVACLSGCSLRTSVR